MREEYWDWIKALAIVAVIGIHACDFNGINPGSFEAEFMTVVRQVINFAVAIFLAVSGLMAGRSSSPKDVSYVWKRAKAILWPYLVWSGVFILLFQPGHLKQPGALALDILTGTGMTIGYFVIVLLQFTILTPVLDRIRPLWLHMATMAAATAAGVAFSYYVNGADAEIWSKFPYSGLPFFVWSPFFHLGYVVGQRVDISKPLPALLAAAVVATLLFLALSILEGISLLPYDAAFAASQTKATSRFYSLALFAALVLAYPYFRARSLPMLAWIGRNSFVIYFAHLIPLRVVARLGEAIGLARGPMYIFSAILVTLLVCCLGAWIARRTIPSALQVFILG